ncbi:MAG TPA: hypothetical protein VEV16_03405 [Daejeonella sp.]|nr:hypothetical protein [Daejeonella sp.]
MSVQEIDHLTERFYQCVSFNAEHYPDFDLLEELFYGSGKLINNNFEQPSDFDVQSFVHALMIQIEAGNATHFAQQEISDRTEVFGTMAQRISVYEYNTVAHPGKNWKKGVNFIQYVYSDGKWLIASMIWKDEGPDLPIPKEYLDL